MTEKKAKGFTPSGVYPEYSNLATDWNFFLDAYESSVSDYTEKYLVKNSKEGNEEFNARKELAYKENHCKQIINLFNSYLYKEKPTRLEHNENAKKYWSKFSKDCDGSGTTMDLFMRKVDKYSSALGRVYVVMDRKDISNTGTHLDDLTSKHYAYMVTPQNMEKVAFDEYNNIKWCIIREYYLSDDDPFSDDSLYPKVRHRLWTENHWYLYHDEDPGLNKDGAHNVGVCPVFFIDNAEKTSKYDGLSLISEAAYIDRSIFNNLSRLSNIIDDQTFSQLVMPVESFVFQDQESQDDVLMLSTKRVLMFSAQAGQYARPEFISPDASQAELILKVIEKQIHQLYNSLGLQSEVQDATTTASGSSKEYDYSRLNSFLTSKAERLEELENKIVKTLAKWMSTDLDVEIIYPESFSIKSLQQEILIAQELALLKISDTFQKELNKRIAKKALPKASKGMIETIEKEISESTPLDPDGMVEIEKEATLADIKVSKTQAASNVATAREDDNGNKNTADRMKANDKGGSIQKEQQKITNL